VTPVRLTAEQVSTKCQIFPIKSALCRKVNKVEILLLKFDMFVQSDLLLTIPIFIRGEAHYYIYS
jgi:hypothetical protein